MPITRRSFVSSAAAGVAGGLVAAPAHAGTGAAAQAQTAASRNAILGANDRVRVGFIGVGGMGRSHLNNFQQHDDVQAVTVCDLWEVNRLRAQRMTERQRAGAATVETDFRRVIDRKDLDAVVVATSDHWHAIPMILACQSGKDVYVEKPISHNVKEGRAMVDAARKYDRVVQVGTQQRSGLHFQKAIEIVQAGTLGTLHRIHTWNVGNNAPAGLGRVPDGAPPAGIDWDVYLGPAPKVPFNANRFIFNFRWFWDYAGGMMTDWGVHLLDYGLLGMKAPVPKTVVSLGGIFAYPELAQETPDTLTALYEFDNFNLIWDHAMGIDNGSYGRDHGIAYIGNNATLVLDRGGWEVIEEKNSQNKISKALAKPTDNGLDKHWENFVSVVRSRKMSDLHCSVEDGAHVATVAQMGNISYRSGERVEWDKAAEKFTSNKLNKEYMMKEYHNGYKLPK